MSFAYFAPELTFPLASALVATIGFILLVGRAPLRIASRGLRLVARPFRSAARGFRSVADRVDL